MVKADYSYMMYNDDHGPVIVITDNKTPNKMSVTNDIENVVEEILITEKLNPKATDVVYEDSEFNWDGWDIVKGKFIHLGCDNADSAIAVLRSIQNEQKQNTTG